MFVIKNLAEISEQPDDTNLLSARKSTDRGKYIKADQIMDIFTELGLQKDLIFTDECPKINMQMNIKKLKNDKGWLAKEEVDIPQSENTALSGVYMFNQFREIIVYACIEKTRALQKLEAQQL